MKKTTVILAALFLSSAACFSQSKSFITLQEKFSNEAEVFSINTSGFLARFLFRVAGEHEFLDAIEDVKHVRMMVIPQRAFSAQHVTLSGFKKIAQQDNFELIAEFRDRRDQVTMMIQSGKKKKDNRYLILINENDEVIAIELKGYLDPDKLRNHRRDLAYYH